MISDTAQCSTATQPDTTIINDLELAGSGASHAPNSDNPRITVKEAARRLNVSPSKIYRMDRTDGPFPIAKIGWHVFIELAGFESFLAGNLCQPSSDSELPVFSGVGAAQDSARAGDWAGSTPESVMSDAKPATPGTDRPRAEPVSPAKTSGSGQRDLWGWTYTTTHFS